MKHALLLPLVLAAAACGGTPAPRAAPAAPGAVVPGASPAPVPAQVAVVPYDGAFAHDPLVVEFPAASARAAAALVPRLDDEAGLRFPAERTPRIVLVDGTEVPPRGEVVVRAVEGLRRPEVRVRAASVASAEFRARDHLAPLLVEAAILLASGERAPPEVLRAGFAVHLSGTTRSRIRELALLSPDEPLSAALVAPLLPAFRASAVARIGVGERPLRRYLAQRLTGSGDEAALREIGTSSEFLEAAAETERDRALEDAALDAPLASLRTARVRLAHGDADAAEAALRGRVTAEATLDSEAEVIRGEIALARDDGEAAVAHLSEALRRPETLFRVREACWLQVRATERAGPPEALWIRIANYTRWFPEGANTERAAGAVGIDVATLRALVGKEPATRAAAATALGTLRIPGAAECLRGALRDGQSIVRRAATTALGRLADPSVAPELDVLCGDADPAVRAAAIASLAAVAPARGAQRAESMRGDPDPDVRRAVEAIVGPTTPVPAGTPKPAGAKGSAPAGSDPAPPPPPGPKSATPAPTPPAGKPAAPAAQPPAPVPPPQPTRTGPPQPPAPTKPGVPLPSRPPEKK